LYADGERVSSSTTRFIPLLPLAAGSKVRAGSRPLDKVESASSHCVDAETTESTIAENGSDEALLARVSIGDTDSLSCIFRRYARVVRSVAYKILRDQFEADDLLQEIFILIHKKASTFDSSKASVRFWILQMTYHRAISRRRYLKSRRFYAHVDLEHVEAQLGDSRNHAEQLEHLLDGELKHAALQKLMAGLSDNQQKTLRLYFFEGYTLDEIASELGQSRENVRHHYFRGLDKLRKQIFSKQIDENLRNQIFCCQDER